MEFKCRTCATLDNCQVVQVKEMMYGSHEVFDYAICSHCGTMQICTIPHDLARHYPSNYYSQLPRTEPLELTGIKGMVMRWYCRSAALKPNAPIDASIRSALPTPGDLLIVGDYLREAHLKSTSERILDVGCGSSPHRLAAMRRCGFTAVEGIDPFIAEDAVYEGVPVYRRTIENVEGTFGLVMFHHSLEHVPDPVSTLKEAARLLRPGGTCLIRIPLMGTYFWRRFGVNWVEIDAPRHLHLMTREAISIMADLAGFQVRHTAYDSGPWEIAQSILYEHGESLADSNDEPVKNLQDHFDKETRSAFAEQVAELNAQGDAGRACFYLVRC